MKYYEKETFLLIDDYKTFYNNQINLDPGFENYKVVDQNLYKQFLNDNGKLYQQNTDKELADSMSEIIRKLYHNNLNKENILPSPLNFDLNIYNIIKKELKINIFSDYMFNEKLEEQKENVNFDLRENLNRYYKRSVYNKEYTKEEVKEQINTITHSTLKNKNNMSIESEESLDIILLFNEEEYDISENVKEASILEEYLRYNSLPATERKIKPMSIKIKNLNNQVKKYKRNTKNSLDQIAKEDMQINNNKDYDYNGMGM